MKSIHVFYPIFGTKVCKRCGLTLKKGNHYR